MKQSLGILEVVGMTTAVNCIDAMVKSAYVEIDRVESIGAGFLTIMIVGDLASVQVGIEIGSEIAARDGSLQGNKVIPRPYEGLDAIFTAEEKVIKDEKI